MSEEIANQSESATTTTTQEAAPASAETVTTQPEAPAGIPIKFNGAEEIVPLEEAPELIQKGKNYEKAIERAKQEARDSYIADQGYTYNGKPIVTEAEYKQALKDTEAYNSLKEKELPDEVIQEMIENRNFREQYNTEKQTQAQIDKQDADFKAFFESYPTVDVTKDIPASVWEDVSKGKSILDAYIKHENKSLKDQLAAATAAKQIEKQNEANAASSTGSVTGNGSIVAEAFTREQVAAMSSEDMKKNYTQVVASMKTWKK